MPDTPDRMTPDRPVFDEALVSGCRVCMMDGGCEDGCSVTKAELATALVSRDRLVALQAEALEAADALAEAVGTLHPKRGARIEAALAAFRAKQDAIRREGGA